MMNIEKNNTTGFITNLLSKAGIFCFFLLINYPVFTQDRSSYFEQMGKSIISVQMDEIRYKSLLSVFDNAASNYYALEFSLYDSVEISPISDSYIDFRSPSSNFGTETYLAVYGKGGGSRGRFGEPDPGYEKVSYLKFQLPEIDGPILSAELMLYSLSNGYGGGVFYLNPNEDILNWNEYSVTWNTMPTLHPDGGNPGTFLDFIDEVSINNWYHFNVTDLFNTTLADYSFAIVMRENKNTLWASRESAYPPILKIYYGHKKFMGNIKGNILYYTGNKIVPNVNVALSALDYSDSLLTYQNRPFTFAYLEPGKDYLLQAKKPSYSDTPQLTILAYDAAVTARAAVELIFLTDQQKVAGDVDLNGEISSFDAVLIARHAVGLPALPESNVAHWMFLPDSLQLFLTENDTNSYDFTGILLGDVHGGWSNSRNLKKIKKSKLDVFSERVNDDTLIINFEIPGKPNISSFDLSIRYNPYYLKYFKHRYDDQFSDFILNQNISNNEIKLNGYVLNQILYDNEFLEIKFVILRDVEDVELEIPYFIVNDYKPLSTIVDIGSFDSLTEYSTFNLLPGYPNPFNSEITLTFIIPEPGNLSVRIYNPLGKIVNQLYQGKKKRGKFNIIWNGKNDIGDEVASGLYFIRVGFNNEVLQQKVIFLR